MLHPHDLDAAGKLTFHVTHSSPPNIKLNFSIPPHTVISITKMKIVSLFEIAANYRTIAATTHYA